MYVLKRKKYYISTVVFNVLSVIFIAIAYHFGFLGYKDVPLKTLLLVFLNENFLNPIDLIFIILILVLLFLALLQKIKEGKDKEIMFPNTKLCNIFFLSIIFFMYGSIFYLYFSKIGSGSLVAFIMIFANMILFHYIYINKFHEKINQ